MDAMQIALHKIPSLFMNRVAEVLNEVTLRVYEYRITADNLSPIMHVLNVAVNVGMFNVTEPTWT